MTTAVYFDTNALYISDVRDAFVAGTLVCERDGDLISICRANEGSRVLQRDYQQIVRKDGTGFDTAIEAQAYLDGEFSRRRPTGDAYVVGVNISAPAQRVVPLQAPPSVLSSVRLVVNGVEYRAPDIVASDVAVTWLNPSFDLDPTDRVTVIYS